MFDMFLTSFHTTSCVYYTNIKEEVIITARIAPGYQVASFQTYSLEMDITSIKLIV